MHLRSFENLALGSNRDGQSADAVDSSHVGDRVFSTGQRLLAAAYYGDEVVKLGRAVSASTVNLILPDCSSPCSSKTGVPQHQLRPDHTG
jgi:hypothetical protein